MTLVDLTRVHGTNGDLFLIKKFVRGQKPSQGTFPSYRHFPRLFDSLGHIDRGESHMVLNPKILWAR